MRRMFALLLCTFSLSCFAVTSSNLPCASNAPEKCDKAPDTADPNFCTAFKPIAVCHCMKDGNLPEKLCPTGKVIYQRMIAAFGSQEAACRWQEKNGSPERTSYQECMDDWNCYMKGGVDSKGGLCNATGKPCE